MVGKTIDKVATIVEGLTFCAEVVQSLEGLAKTIPAEIQVANLTERMEKATKLLNDCVMDLEEATVDAATK